MRVKHYIVTYRNPIWADCARSILRTPTEHARTIHLINNHSEFTLPDDLVGWVEVLHNVLRPDRSTGHLARNWNEALMHGFGDLTRPEADIVVTSQNDAVFETGYLDRLITAHEHFDLITAGVGDNCVSYTARAVRRVGMWDERFCSIFHQEGDYFARAAMFLAAHASINDHPHGRVRNPIDIRLCERADVTELHRLIRNTSAPNVHLTQAVWNEKWEGIRDWPWTPPDSPMGAPETARIKARGYILYPYFESAVETLAEQNVVR